ncbi:flagellar protein FlhE [Halovibrio sp. HP20-50]|uniref:flagellar protein FlhE n=1 Tax=Halovibrio sp. HP20-59 TaxID=3080275 RepID=UPI00294ADB6E|nr:flagellar protein FlhE [Halovibrio sp. HP20-59]MEA2119506.1 flagellar protein FlhE [Halovibrio sp. HP20-59]
MLSWPVKTLGWVVLLITQLGNAHAVAGSWSTQVPGLMVAMSDRASATQEVAPPAAANVEASQIERVQWQFQYPPGARLNAWLCHPEQCVALTGMRGSTRALAGQVADAPLHFRFALHPGQRPVRVQGLQMIVNYQ